MLHARSDYNRIQDPDNKIGADEPVFIIRAKDQVSGPAVRAWADLAEAAGAEPEIIRLARMQADRMDEWNIKQVPDL